MAKTIAIRMLEAQKIPFATHDYEWDENNLDAVSVAEKVGAEVESVFKTLVTIGDKNGYNVFCIPANFELDLKKAAKVSGNKSIRMLKVKDLLAVTGYIRGGCTPIGMKKKFPVYIEETAELFDEIYISAGVRGTQIKLSPQDLQKMVDAVFCEAC